MKPALLALGLSLPLVAQQAAPAATPAQAAAPAPAATPAPASAAAPAPAPKAAPAPGGTTSPVLDDGLLQTSWFGPGLTFQKAEGDAVDFFWIKPGLDLTGKSLEFGAWEDPVQLKAGRDKKDKERAEKLTDSFPGLLMRGLEPAFGTKIKAVKRGGDYLLIGRIVDANAKSTAARFFAPAAIGAAETATWDFKILDGKTQELVAAFHHRVVSATVMSTIDSKIGKWMKEFGPFLVQKTTH